MSELLDERVVEMRFDNSDFEQNVNKSINTINRLKESLDFEEAGESFDNISKAAASCDLTPMEKSIEEISVKFDILDMVAANVIGNIVNKVADAGIKLAKNLTIDQVTAGWTKYEQKTQSVQTIMSATGRSIDDINAQLDKLIWFADETSYSFVDMVNNIGKFTAAGIDLETAVNSMMGISDWAALAGAGIPQASRAMYNLSQSMSMGYVAIQDWKSIELANMATMDFKESVIEAALALGTIEKVGDEFRAVGGKITFTAESMRNSLRERWFTNDVLNMALSEYSEFANKVHEYQEKYDYSTANDAIAAMEAEGEDLSTRAAQAFIKAQEALSFTQVKDAIRDAVSSQWMRTFEMIFGNYEQAKKIWTKLANDLWDIFAAPGDRFNEMLEDVLSSDYQKMANELPDKLEFNNRLYKKLYDITKANAGKDYADALFAKYDNIEDLLKNNSIFGSTLQTAFQSVTKDYDEEYERLILSSKNFEDHIISLKQVAIRLSSGQYGRDEETITKNLEKIGLKYEEVAEYAEIWYELGDAYNWDEAQKEFEKGLKEQIKLAKESRGKLREYLNMEDLFESLSNLGGRDKLIGGFENIMFFVKNFYKFILEIIDGLSHLFGRESFLSLLIDGFYNLTGVFDLLGTGFKMFIDPVNEFFNGGIQKKFNDFIHGYDRWVEDAKTLKSGMVVGAFEHVPGLIERITSFFKSNIDSIPDEVEASASQITETISGVFNNIPKKFNEIKEGIFGVEKTYYTALSNGTNKLETVREGGILNEWKESIASFGDGIIFKALNGVTNFLERIKGFLFGYKNDTEEFEGAISWVYNKVKAFIDLLKTIGKSAKGSFETVFSDIKTFFTGGKYSFSDSTIWALPARLKKHFEDLKKTPAFQEIKRFFFGEVSADGATVIEQNIFGKISKAITDLTTSKAFTDVKAFFFGKELNQNTFGQATHIPGFFERIGTTISNLVTSIPFKEIKAFILGDFETGTPSIFGKISKAILGITEKQTYKDIKNFLFGNDTDQASFFLNIFEKVKSFIANIGNYIEIVKNKFNDFRRWLGLDFYQYFSWNPETKNFESHWQRIHGAIDIAKDKVDEFSQKINTVFTSIWNSSTVQSVIKFLSGDYFEGNPISLKTVLFGNKETGELSFLEYQLERIKNTDWFVNIKDFLFGKKDKSIGINDNALNSFFHFFHTAEEYEQSNIFGKIKLALQDLQIYLFGWKDTTRENGKEIEGHLTPIIEKIKSITSAILTAINTFRSFLGLDWKQVTNKDGEKSWVRQAGAIDFVWEKIKIVAKAVADFGKKVFTVTNNFRKWLGLDWEKAEDGAWTRIPGALDKIKAKFEEIKNSKAVQSIIDFFLGKETIVGTDINPLGKMVPVIERTGGLIENMKEKAKELRNVFSNGKEWFHNIITNAGYTDFHDFIFGNDKIGLDNVLIRVKNSLHDFFLGNESKGIDNFLVRTKNTLHDFFLGNESKGIDNLFDRIKFGFDDLIHNSGYTSFHDFIFGNDKIGLDNVFIRVIDNIRNKLEELKNAHPWLATICDFIDKKIKGIKQRINDVLPGFEHIYESIKKYLFGFDINKKFLFFNTGTDHVDGLIDRIANFAKRIKKLDIFHSQKDKRSFLERLVDGLMGGAKAVRNLTHITGTIHRILPIIRMIGFLMLVLNVEIGGFRIANPLENIVDPITEFVKSLAIIAGLFIGIPFLREILGIDTKALFQTGIILGVITGLLIWISKQLDGDSSNERFMDDIRDTAHEFALVQFLNTLVTLIAEIGILLIALSVTSLLVGWKNLIAASGAIALILGAIGGMIALMNLTADKAKDASGKLQTHTGELFGIAFILYGIVALLSTIVIAFSWLALITKGKKLTDFATPIALMVGFMSIIGVLLGAIAGIMILLTHSKPIEGKVLGALISLEIFIAVLMHFALLLTVGNNKDKWKTLTAAFIGISVVVLAMAGCLKILSTINNLPIINLLSLIGIFSALAIIVGIFGYLKKTKRITITVSDILKLIVSIGLIAVALIPFSYIMASAGRAAASLKGHYTDLGLAILAFSIIAAGVWGLAVIAKKANIRSYDAIAPMLAAIGEVAVAIMVTTSALAASGVIGSLGNHFKKGIITAIGGITVLAFGVWGLAAIANKANIHSYDAIAPMLAAIGEVAVAIAATSGLLTIASVLGSITNKMILGLLTAIAGITVLAFGVWGLTAIANKANIHSYDAILPMLAAIGEVAVAIVVTSGLLAIASVLGSITNTMILGLLTSIAGITVLAFGVWGLAAIANKANIHSYDAILPMLAAIGEVAAAIVVTAGLLAITSVLGSITNAMILGLLTSIGGITVLAFGVWGLAAIANKANIHSYDAILPMLAAIGEVAAAMVVTSGLLAIAGILGMGIIAVIPGIIAAIAGFGILTLALYGLSKISENLDTSTLEKATEFIVGIGKAFGEMIGAFIGGIGEGLTESLPQIGSNISGFMTALQPFLNSVKAIDDSYTTGAINFMAVMGTIVADEALGWLATLFDNFASDKTKMAINLCSFIAALEPFLSRISSLTEADITGAAIFTAIMTSLVADEALAWVTTLLDNFSGNDKVGAATNLSKFVSALNPFLSGVTQLKEEHKQGASLLSDIMQEIVKTDALAALDNIIKYFCGTIDYNVFVSNLKIISDGAIELHKKLNENGITKDIIDADISIIKSILDLATDNKYKSGGLAGLFDSIINGKTQFKELFEKLNTEVIDGFSTFAGKVKGIDAADAQKAAEVLPSILNILSGNGYRVGGIKGWFTNIFEGENNYNTMFNVLLGSDGQKGIIDYMSELSTKIKSLDNLNESDLSLLSSASNAIKSVFNMMAFNASDLINDKRTEIFGHEIGESDFDKLVSSLEIMINGTAKHPGGIPGMLSDMEEKLKSIDSNIIESTIGTFLDLIKMMSSISSGDIELDTEGISEIGKYVVEGLALSLESDESTSRIKIAAINLGKSIIEGLQIGTEEESPSKAAMVVGQFVAQGLTNGLLAGEPLTWAMARQFGEGTIKALQEGAERYDKYGLAKHAINMVTEDLLDENIFNMPDFSFINHLGMEDIDFEKMRSFLQEKFGEVFDPTVIDGFVNSYKHQWEQLPKEIKNADYAKTMVDIAKGEYGVGQDAIIESLTEEMGTVEAAEQAWEDYNKVLEGSLKINKDLLKQKKEDPPMTYEQYIDMIKHEQEGIDLLNKGFFNDLAKNNGTTVEQEMEKLGYNPKTTQQAIDAMYMSSEEFYKAYEAYINRKADEAEQDRLLREQQKEYDDLANSVRNAKEQTDNLADSKQELNHLAANVEGVDANGVVAIDDTGARHAVEKVDSQSKDIVDTIIENYQNGVETSQELIQQLLLNKVADGADPNKTIYPQLEKAGIEVQDFFDYLSEYATENQNNLIKKLPEMMAGPIEETSERVEEATNTVETSTTKYVSSIDKVNKIWGKSADELLKSGELVPQAIDYLKTADSKALNDLITNINKGSYNLTEADKVMLNAFQQAVMTYGAFGVGTDTRKNNFTLFGISEDNLDFAVKYSQLGDKYIDQLKEEKKATAKVKDQNDEMAKSGEDAANSWLAGATGIGKGFTDLLSTAIEDAAKQGLDKISITPEQLASVFDLPVDEIKKNWSDKLSDKGTFDISAGMFDLKVGTGKFNKEGKEITKVVTNFKDIAEKIGTGKLVTGILGTLGLEIDDTLGGGSTDLLNQFLSDPTAIIGGLADINKTLHDQNGIWGFLNDKASSYFLSLLGINDVEEEISSNTIDFKTDNKELEQSQAYIESLYNQYKLLVSDENLVKSGYKQLANGGAISKQQADALTKMYNGVTIGAYGDVNAFHEYLDTLEVDWDTFLTYYRQGLENFTSTAQSYAAEVKANTEYTTADLVKDMYNGKWGEGLDRKKAFDLGNIDYDKAHEAYKYWLENGQDDEKLFEKYGTKRYAILTDEEKELLEQTEKFETALATTSEGAFKSIGDFLKGVNQVLSNEKTAENFNKFINDVVSNLETKTLANAPALEQIGNFLRSVKSVSNESSHIGESFKKAIDDIFLALESANIPESEQIQTVSESITSIVNDLNALTVEEEKINPVTQFFSSLVDAFNVMSKSKGVGIQEFVDNMYSALDNSASDAAEPAEKIVSEILAVFDAKKQDFTTRGSTFIDWLAAGMEANMTAAVDAANAIVSAIISAFADGATASVAGEDKSILDIGKDFVSEIAKGLESEESKTLIDGAMKSLFGLGEATTEGLTGQASGMLAGASGITGSIGQQIGQQFSQDFVTGFSTSLAEGGVGAEALTTLQSVFSSLGMSAQTGEEGETSGIVQNITDSFSQIGEGLQAAVKGEAGKAIEKASEEIQGKMAAAVPDGYSLGYNFVAGLAQGIADAMKVFDLGALGFSAGSAVNAGVTKAGDLGSPSKVMYQFGRYYVEGFVNGLGKDHSDMYYAGYDIGDATNEGVRDSLGIHSPSLMAQYLASNFTGTYVQYLLKRNSDIRKAGESIGNETYDSINNTLGVFSDALQNVHDKLNENEFGSDPFGFSEAGLALTRFGKVNSEQADLILEIWTNCMNGVYGVMDNPNGLSTRDSMLMQFGLTWDQLSSYSDGMGHLTKEALMQGKDFSSAMAYLGDTWDVSNVIDTIRVKGLTGKDRTDFVKSLGLDPQTVQNIINDQEWNGVNFDWANYDLSTGADLRLEETNEKLEETTDDLLNAADKVEDNAHKIDESTKNAILAFGSNNPSYRSRMGGLPVSVQNTLSNVLSSTTTTFSQAGKNGGKTLFDSLKQGIADKFQNAKNWLADKASQLAGAANKAVEDKEGINSPSKVFMQYGEYMVRGLAIGIQSNTNLAEESTGNMADTISSLFSGSVSNISDMVESDLNTEPVIRPVIDMSEVESSASSIDAMLSRDRAVDISTYEDQDIQNGEEGYSPFGNHYEFIQNNYSPKALSRLEIYRQTKNQFAMMKGGAYTS